MGVDLWQADHFAFTVEGQGAQGLFTQAAEQGVHLSKLERCGRGYRAVAAGRDRAALQELAAAGGWRLTVLRRSGPGHLLERLLARPGVAMGCAVLGLLLQILPGFVWAMDFAALPAQTGQRLRSLLAENGVWEGSWLDRERLRQVQQQLELHNDLFGWLSLNFTGGCLYVESTPMERQNIEPAPHDTTLYARADAEILAVNVDSGFACVQPGQYVKAGQALAADVRAARDGQWVEQAASGRVLGRVTLRYHAAQPLQETKNVLTGRAAERRTLCLLGRQWALEGTSEMENPGNTLAETEWQPLRLGRVALPGCIRRETFREKAEQTLRYTKETAAAMARRACRLALAADFPDAVVEAREIRMETTEDTVYCTARYTFRADIARAAAGGEQAAEQP